MFYRFCFQIVALRTKINAMPAAKTGIQPAKEAIIVAIPAMLPVHDITGLPSNIPDSAGYIIGIHSLKTPPPPSGPVSHSGIGPTSYNNGLIVNVSFNVPNHPTKDIA